ncbi:MAG: PolC-type DNA polymerase III [Clostridia bacterium]|nr:PolC-type DNA polymerase III [Clostridia bacterium]
MDKIRLLDKVNRYEPGASVERWLGSVMLDRFRADKAERKMELFVECDRVIPKAVLYEAEEGIRKTYELSSVHIFPHYGKDLFSEAYIPELITETEKFGLAAKGFFDGYSCSLEDGVLKIMVPLREDGIEMMYDKKTPELMCSIVKREFDTDIRVIIERDVDAELSNYYEDMQNMYDRQLYEIASREYERAEEKDDDASADGPILTRISSVYDQNIVPEPSEDGKSVRIGYSTFAVDSPEQLHGDSFEIKPISIASIRSSARRQVVVGEVFNYKATPTKAGDKVISTFGLFDGSASIAVRVVFKDPEKAYGIEKYMTEGQAVIAAVGSIERVTRNDVKSEDFTFSAIALAKIRKISRTDDAAQKRVELHLHTTMSAMDALIPPDKAVSVAKDWGHSAIAITDHGNAQGFPEAMKMAEKTGMKVIYGMEAYFVNDTAKAVRGAYEGQFTDEMIVVDIETTGLSVRNCRITEIGAVRLRNGAVTERFDTFVNPEVPIPKEIQEKTSITDEMVAQAPKVGEAIRMFLSFIGPEDVRDSRLLIGHNADFDIGFLRYYAEQNGMSLNNPYLDTLALSRFLNADMKSHKLDDLAERYSLGDFQHHRACDDANMTGLVFLAMVRQLLQNGTRNFSELVSDMEGKTDPKRLNAYHQILLVKNTTGLKNLYRLISESYLNYYYRTPRIPKTELEKYREGLLVGSACEAGELFRAILGNRTDDEIESIVDFYDYLEIQPISNNRFLVEEGTVADDEGLREINRKIVELGEKYNRPVVATCDAHFLNPEDEIGRKILLSGMKFKDADRNASLYLRTTEEMLEEFAYLGKEKAFEVVVTNPNLINDQIERVRPIPEGAYPPHLDGAEEELQKLCWDRARKMYGDPVPELVKSRLEKELGSIIKNGFAVLYIIAQKLVRFSEDLGYLVGSRGSVGSSFVAPMAGISEVNPLPPHYYCEDCGYSEFITDGSYGSGFDLPDKNCPICGRKMAADGHNIPFETFLGFYGEKSPDIDLNFSGEVQARIHKYTEELFGAENVFKAGTIGTLQDKTAFGFVIKYMEDRGISICNAEMDRLVNLCVGVKRTTGQHPGGIIVVPRDKDVYDFTPVQHPADDPDSDIVTTHFAFSYLHDTILKLDELGHDVPTKYKWAEKFSNTSVMDVPMNDKAVYELFRSTTPLGVTPNDIGCNLGTLGLPEFGTNFAMRMLETAKPETFADLLQISGLSHGTDVWTGNAEELIKSGACNISQVIGCRDNIMNDLIRFGVEKSHAFKIMESVRKGKGLTPEWVEEINASSAPDWYIDSCRKIKYMFPKAHAAAYVMSAIRLGWYKVHMPQVFYATMLTVAPGSFDAEIVRGGRREVRRVMDSLDDRGRDELSAKEKDTLAAMKLVNEAMARKIEFLPVDLEKSHSFAFLPEGERGLRMPFSALPGLGENASNEILLEREKEPFFSVEDLQVRTGLSKTVIETLRRNGVLKGLSETAQLSFF